MQMQKAGFGFKCLEFVDIIFLVFSNLKYMYLIKVGLCKT